MKLTILCFYICNIFGNLKLDNKWKSVIYILEIKKYDDFFNGNSNLILDSILINFDGTFNSNIELKKNCFYRLNVVKNKNSNNGASIYRGINDNFIFINNIKKIKINSNIIFFQKSLSPTNNFYSDFYIQYRFKSKNYLTNNIENCESDECIGKLQDSLLNLMKIEDDYIIKKEFTKNDIYKNIFLLANIEETSKIKYTKLYKKQVVDILHKKSTFLISYDKFVSENFSDIGRKIQNIKLSNLTHLYDIKNNKFILINFWASWCKPCIKEIKLTLKPLYEKYSDKVDIISLSMDKKIENFIAKSRELNIKWINECLECSKNEKIMNDINVEYLPKNILLDSNFNIINSNIDEVGINDFKNKLK